MPIELFVFVIKLQSCAVLSFVFQSLLIRLRNIADACDASGESFRDQQIAVRMQSHTGRHRQIINDYRWLSAGRTKTLNTSRSGSHRAAHILQRVKCLTKTFVRDWQNVNRHPQTADQL